MLIFRRVAGLTALLALAIAPQASAEWVEVERNLRCVTGGLNHYVVGFHWLDGLEDLADSSLEHPCNTGGAGGDGLLNADDMLCTLWTSRQGMMTVTDMNAGGNSCWATARTVMEGEGGSVRLFGTAFEFRPGAAYYVAVGKFPWQPDLNNWVTLRGRCSEPYEPRVIEPLPCKQYFAIPLDHSYRNGLDIACGTQDPPLEEQSGLSADECDDGLLVPQDGASLLCTPVSVIPWGINGTGFWGLKFWATESADGEILVLSVGTVPDVFPGSGVMVAPTGTHPAAVFDPERGPCPPNP